MMSNGKKEKRSAHADTPEEAREIVRNRNKAERPDAPRIVEMRDVDM